MLALRNLEEAEGTSKTTLVVRVLSPAIRGICSQSVSKRGEHVEELWAVASQTGNFDTLVFACRAYPDLLDGVARVADRDRLISLLGGANDTELADRYGIGVHRRNRSGSMNLTPRETEIMDLVAAGLSNREIGESLFITESTVKAHLRHAYEKLRVRGRAEAVPKWLTRR
jgi:DNA-binding CsgD family transcriptional regulator